MRFTLKLEQEIYFIERINIVKKTCNHSLSDLVNITCSDLGLPENSYAQMPTPVVKDGKIRVYFTNRDEFGRSKPYTVDLDPISLQPLAVASPIKINLGGIGTFDEDGIMPSSVVDTADGQYLYYIGWNRGSIIPYRLSIGLAIGEHGQENFEKVSAGPVMDRSTSNPFFVTTPQVTLIESKFVMWFSSGTGWIQSQGKNESVYKIMKSESDDGKNWTNFASISFGESANSCLARPFSFDSHIYLSERGATGFREPSKGYRIFAYTISENLGTQKCNLDWEVGAGSTLDRAYASVVLLNGRRLLFYNGDSFGKSGFSVALEEIERFIA